MVGEHRRGHRRDSSRVLGNHQRCWLWGRHAVEETLQAGRWLPLEVLLSDQFAPPLKKDIAAFCRKQNVPLEVVPSERITDLCHARDHQGLAARMPPFPYQTVDAILGQASKPELLVLLEAVQDPFNLGAICRAAHVFGADGLLVGSRGQAEVSSQVARSSAGAINRLPIGRGDDVISIAKELRQRGILVIGTAPQATANIHQFDFQQPVAVVIGNEGTGISAELIKHCDAVVSIPQATTFDSLNAAVSAGVLLYEIHRQRLSHLS